MEQGCCYQKYAKCKECSYVTYNECKTFRLWRTKWLLKDILPMTLRKVTPLKKGYCYFGTNEDLMKQYAANTALKLQKQLRKLKLNQLISIVLEQEEFNASVVYVECKKSIPDNIKIQQVVESFVDKLVMKGVTVFIFSYQSVIKPADDWRKISKKEEEDL
jgi:hypothetical protein